MNIITIANSSELNNFFNCHNIKAGTYFENPNANNLDIQVKMCCTSNKLFLGKTDLTAQTLVFLQPQNQNIFQVCLSQYTRRLQV